MNDGVLSKAEQLQLLRDQLEADLPHLPLGDIGEQTVPGDGNPESEIMFIGESLDETRHYPVPTRSGPDAADFLRGSGFMVRDGN
jgi:hypothetical protein